MIFFEDFNAKQSRVLFLCSTKRYLYLKRFLFEIIFLKCNAGTFFFDLDSSRLIN